MSAARQPVLFIGHGNPMRAITDNPYRRAWQLLGAGLPRPRAILCVSAHWETGRSAVCVQDLPPTIHDFGGFPPELHAQRYPAPGAPALAREAQALVGAARLQLTDRWGLDHGAWCVLSALFPAADVPVAQLSLGRDLSPSAHLKLARDLRPLRDQGVLLLASGNIVHNLGRLSPGHTPDWALAFDRAIADALAQGDESALCAYGQLPGAALSVPTPEHYLPLLYLAGVRHPDEPLQMLTADFDLGSLSMRSIRLG